MAKGSQLSQLKSALSQAGITGNNATGKKRKRAIVEKDKDKKAAKLDEIHRKLNPFDVKVTKLKHDVGGRKLKGIMGRPAQSKSAGIEQRKKTLLKEWEEKNKAGGIIDRRIGENNPDMSPEERMLERFTKERQRASKSVAFNLDDEDELTHYGQSLSKLDDFDDVGLQDLDEEEFTSGQIDRKIVSRTHFGGFGDEDANDDEVDEPARKKSKAEVMAEVIAKSKEHRLRRHMEKEHEENLRNQLDEDFDTLRDLIFAPDPSSSGSNSVPLGKRVETTPATPSVPAPPEPQDIDYDQRVRELAFDKRSKPKDRTKTEEELALEAKEALETAERKRRKRMLGIPESDSEDEGPSRGKRKRGGDDLDDDFDVDEEPGLLGAGLSEGADARSGERSGSEEVAESDGGESDDGVSGAEEEEDEDEDDASESDGGEHENLTKAPKSGVKASKRQAASTEVPFVFPCPTSHEEFLHVTEGISDADIPTVVERIRALHHTSLSPENKFKLQTFTTVILDHILYITSPPTPRFSLVAPLITHLRALVRAYPIPAAQNFVVKLSLMQKNLKRGLSHGALDLGSKTWPGISELSLLRIIGDIWPTSDLNHAVVSPTRVLMGSYLGLGRVRSLSDVASGLFLCSTFHQFESLSKRYILEAINFLVNTVLHIAPHSYTSVDDLPGSFPCPDFASDLCRPLALARRKSKTLVSQKANLPALLATPVPTEQAKADLLYTTIEILLLYAEMYKALDAFVELYDPVLEIMKNVQDTKLPDFLQERVLAARDTLSRLLKFARQGRKPLALQAHKPIPIPSYIPKFETTSSSYLRRHDPDHERNEASKLRRQYKQEKKGAIRELRKDARFLAGVEHQKQLDKDRAYQTRMKRVFGSIEGERAEEKAMEREKNRDKRRAGRK